MIARWPITSSTRSSRAARSSRVPAGATVTPDGVEETVLEVPEQPSGFGWMPDGSLLVASRKDFRVLRRSTDGAVTEHADLSGMAKGHLNDMVVNARGRAYV